MSDKKKMLKIKVGEVYIDGTSHPVYTTAWEVEDKKGNTFYSVSTPIFVNEYEDKGKK